MKTESLQVMHIYIYIYTHDNAHLNQLTAQYYKQSLNLLYLVLLSVSDVYCI